MSIEIAGNQIGVFSCDGDFTVKVVDGKAVVTPLTQCFNYENDPKWRKFAHDCDKCAYLGFYYDSYDKYSEGYLCIKESETTLVARHGSKPEEYTSGLNWAHHEGLKHFGSVAKANGLLK